MLNPILSNFSIMFTDDFFPKEITSKYDTFLFHKNGPFKDLNSFLYESIKGLTIPGFNIKTNDILNLNNLGINNNNDNLLINRYYPQNAPINELIDSNTISLNFRNSILNWMYLYEMLFSYYKRKRSINDFCLVLTLNDSAEIPMIRFKFSDCFATTLPGLSFAYNENFSTSKEFECGFVFNEMEIDFIVPNFDLNKLTL